MQSKSRFVRHLLEGSPFSTLRRVLAGPDQGEVLVENHQVVVVLLFGFRLDTPVASPLNAGVVGTRAELAAMIAEIVGYRGRFAFDRSKPDGTPRKLLDVSRLSDLGWRAKIDLRTGIAATYDWYLANPAAA